MIAEVRHRLPLRVPRPVTAGSMALFVLLVLGYGPWVLLVAVVVPVALAVLIRPQRGVLLLAALLPFHGLLVLTSVPDAVWAWKEVLTVGVLVLTFAARPEIRGASDRERPRWFPALAAWIALAVVSAFFVPQLIALFGLKMYFF